jgi:hypothetical protein
MKVDGCGPNSYYKEGYAAMGKGLQNSGRDIVYSCSWPAYIGSDETVKPFQEFIDDGKGGTVDIVRWYCGYSKMVLWI